MNNSINLIIGIIFLLIFCLFIGIDFKSTLIIILMCSIIMFIFKNVNDINVYYNNRFDNITKDEINNYIKLNDLNNKNNTLKNLENTKNTSIKKICKNKTKIFGYNNNKYPNYGYKDNTKIIPDKYYNLEDCTTDMSCIIKPDKHNLGIINKKNNLSKNNLSKNNLSKNNLSKNDNNISITNNDDEGIILEKFTNKLSPMELNDLKHDFGDNIIESYEKKNNYYKGPVKNYDDRSIFDELAILENKNYSNKDKNILDKICFHCKVGKCDGDVCKDLNELKYKSLKNEVDEIIDKGIKKYHPYSNNFPTIRISNPESRF